MLRLFIHFNTGISQLHWAKEIMIQVPEVNCLMDHHEVGPSIRTIVSESSTHDWYVPCDSQCLEKRRDVD